MGQEVTDGYSPSNIDSCGGNGGQQRSTAIASKMPIAKANLVALSTPFLSLLAGGSGQAAAVAARE